MCASMRNLKIGFLMLFVVLYLLRSMVDGPVFPYAMGIVAILTACIGFGDLGVLNRRLIVILLAGSSLLVAVGSGQLRWELAIGENAGLVSLLLTVPLLSFILRYAPYEATIITLANRYIHTGFMAYLTVMGLTFFLATLMSLAALPFMHRLMRPMADRYGSVVVNRALMRGFSFNLFWAPNLICVAVVMHYARLPWLELALPGAAFSLIAIMAAIFLGYQELRSPPQDDAHQAARADGTGITAVQKKQMMWLGVQVALLVVALLAVTYGGRQSTFVAVPLVALAMPLMFAAAMGQIAVYRQELARYLDAGLPGMINQFVLFLAIGFFGHVLGKSQLVTLLQQYISSISQTGPGVLSLVIIVAIAALACIGLHPIITISTLAITLGTMDIALSKPLLGVTFISGYLMYLILSPFSSAVMMMSGMTGENVYRIGCGLNWRYALLLLCGISVSLQLV